MALVMSQMPDVWRKVLAEHVPDQARRCRECRDTSGASSSWPCQTYRVAEEAKWVAEGNLPGTGPHGPGPGSSPRLSRLDEPRAGGYAADSFGPSQERPPTDSWQRPSTDSWQRPSTDSWQRPSTDSWQRPSTDSWEHASTGSYPVERPSMDRFPYEQTPMAPSYPHPTTGSSGLAGDPYPSSGEWSSSALPAGYTAPLAGDPRATPAAAGPGGDVQPYGSTFDAPYGASFGVDDRPRTNW